MITYFLVGLIAFLAIFTKSAIRPLVVFSGGCTMSLIIGNEMSGNNFHYYYAICALVHLLILYAISKEEKITDLIYHIYIINLAFIYLNLFGFIANWAYIEPYYYNLSCEALYSLAVTTIVYNWWFDGFWRSGISRIISFFRGNMCSSLPQLCLREGEKRT